MSRAQAGPPVTLYKILKVDEWRAALAAGVFEGSAADRRDGFIHFSTAGQAGETARLHFAGQGDLVLLAVPADLLGAALKWELARGGQRFPHLYGPLACALVIEARPLPLLAGGEHGLRDLAP